MSLTLGAEAPDFTLPDDRGGEIRLSALRGAPVVVYFYPKDDTSGCTREAVEFTALLPEFRRHGAVVIGVSPDALPAHAKFRAKYDLGVELAADPDKAVLEAWGVWVEKSMYGRKYMGVERTTVLIDAAGRIAAIWNKVKVPGHADAVLAKVAALAG
ncbi:peroxiredoxin [Siculibacillus lacustris]|uniref:thioredoxin-dependent peroxiredoxin n=1 Tax=Siculibacillus lacustris TaxID=1549641 RepID=A0A4Q9VJ05_9HYPH|nr:peroxiredoxin [Siculibacillus lacustris]TBW35246.1 peroxiredoxin [Siculibacillus lacustris]